jgi:cyclophilin family peptidyl-prolyl cis-trans isomerase
MHSAALRSFRANPNQDPQVAQVVFELVTQKLDGTSIDRHFDPNGALEIANLMMESGVDSPQIAYQGFRANYAIQNFEQARELLKQIEAAGAKLNDAILEKLFSSDEKWIRELAIRRTEAIADDLPRVRIKTTEGDFVIELFEDQAPKTVGNFINLVEQGFYNGLDFHLVRPGLLSQAGCPNGDGTGDAGYTIPCETEGESIRHFFAGTVGMANNGPDTGSSQFFISHQPNANFDGNYTAFGRVIEGLPVVFQLQTVDNSISSSDETKPSKIIGTSVIRKRNHSYLPTRLAEKPNTLGQDLNPTPSSIEDIDPDSNPTRSGK